MASTEEALSLVSGVRPRAYQVDLFLEAQKRNVCSMIVFLDHVARHESVLAVARRERVLTTGY